MEAAYKKQGPAVSEVSRASWSSFIQSGELAYNRCGGGSPGSRASPGSLLFSSQKVSISSTELSPQLYYDSAAFSTSSFGEKSCPTDPRFDATHQVRYGVDVVWQIPKNPKAILFLAHGRGCTCLSYFDRSPNCPSCYGLPEDRAIVLEGLARGYACIAIQSAEGQWESWPPETSGDKVIVTKILSEWSHEHSLEMLPLAATGNSAGGSFTSMMALFLNIRSLVLMNAVGVHEVIETATDIYPPTLFIHMPKDSGISGFSPRIQKSYRILKAKGLEVDIIACYEFPIDPIYFTKRIPCLSNEISDKIFSALKLSKYLNDENYLAEDPKVDSSWEESVRSSNALPDCEPNVLCWEEHVREELAVAYANHSITSLVKVRMFDWIDSTVFLPQKKTLTHSRSQFPFWSQDIPTTMTAASL